MSKCVIKRRFYRFAGFDEACVDEKKGGGGGRILSF